MTHVTCRPAAKNRDQLRNPTLGQSSMGYLLPQSGRGHPREAAVWRRGIWLQCFDHLQVTVRCVTVVRWQVVFTQLQYSELSCVPPDAIRRAMALTFDTEDRFQLGLMEDAAECFVSRHLLTPTIYLFI